MTSRRLWTGVWVGASLCGMLALGGCKRKHRGSTDLAQNVQKVVASPQLAILQWANYSDYQAQVKAFYDTREYALAWTDNGELTTQAKVLIEDFAHAQLKGLRPQDYDAQRWPDRVAKINAIHKKNDTSDDAQNVVAQFDAAMTIDAMRYISDLHSGRVNPQHLSFDIDVPAKRAAFDLPTFLNDQVTEAGDPDTVIATVEPQNAMYAATEKALGHYLDLAARQTQPASPVNGQAMASPSAALLPAIGTKAIAVGQPYPSQALYVLESHLALEGDWTGAPQLGTDNHYTQEAADAVKIFQARHGLADDGKLSQGTVDAINVPMAQRVEQLNLSLERWRWLADPYVNPRVLENLAEFQVRTYNADHTLAFKMKTVNGEFKGGHETPVFTRMMRYVVFRPFWNVPPSIIKKELMVHIEKSGVGYLAEKNYEVVTREGQPVSGYSAGDIGSLKYDVREKPGPKNSLGLVKFMFPNEYDVYMHSTPELQLFNLSRRDRSHGCVRLEHADQMAAWVLSGQGDWDEQKIADAMQNEDANNKTVGLKTPLPVVIFYLTATADEDGTIHFFDDVYGYDKSLEDVLDKGLPYPSTPAKINPKLTPGETV